MGGWAEAVLVWGGDRETGSSCGAYLRSMLVLLGVGWAAESRGHDGEEDRWFPHSECYAEGQVWGAPGGGWGQGGALKPGWSSGTLGTGLREGSPAGPSETHLIYGGVPAAGTELMVPGPLPIPPVSRGPAVDAVHSWL